MMKVFPALGAVTVASLLVAPAEAGIPTKFDEQKSKWIRVSKNWQIDTEDVKKKGDRLRFWVRRNPTGNEEMSTQQKSSWWGKYEIRCSDYHARLAAGYASGFGGNYYPWGGWEKMDSDFFGAKLASNFCYLTGTPGYTPEPIEHHWQAKITLLLDPQSSAARSFVNKTSTKPAPKNCWSAYLEERPKMKSWADANPAAAAKTKSKYDDC
jgi:hypothetical protein